jgi:hypothetical protein
MKLKAGTPQYSFATQVMEGGGTAMIVPGLNPEDLQNIEKYSGRFRFGWQAMPPFTDFG